MRLIDTYLYLSSGQYSLFLPICHANVFSQSINIKYYNILIQSFNCIPENKPKRELIRMLVQRGYESDPVAAWTKAQEKVNRLEITSELFY